MKTADYNTTHNSIITTLNTKANTNNPTFTGVLFSPIVNANFLRENGINLSNIYAYNDSLLDVDDKVNAHYDYMIDMIREGAGSVQQTVTTVLRINEQLKIQESSATPSVYMLVSPNRITMNSTLDINSSNATPCVSNNPTGASANIDFRYLTNFWNVGMDGGNFRIKSNWLLSHSIPAGANMASTVAMQINQDGYVNFAGHMNLWGTLYAKQNIWNDGYANFRNDISIRPTVLNTQAGIHMFGGSSSIENYWYVGRGAYNVGQNNFVIGSNMIAPISNGVTQALSLIHI